MAYTEEDLDQSQLIDRVVCFGNELDLPFSISTENLYDGVVDNYQKQTRVVFNVLKEVVNRYDEMIKSTQRKHAHWVKPSPYSESRCSNCYKPPKLLFGMLPDFCPWCGAEMDEQVQGE